MAFMHLLNYSTIVIVQPPQGAWRWLSKKTSCNLRRIRDSCGHVGSVQPLLIPKAALLPLLKIIRAREDGEILLAEHLLQQASDPAVICEVSIKCNGEAQKEVHQWEAAEQHMEDGRFRVLAEMTIEVGQLILSCDSSLGDDIPLVDSTLRFLRIF